MSEVAKEKRCSKCGIVKPLEAYWVQAAGKYGRTARCMECGRAEHAEYKQRKMPPSVKEARAHKQGLLAQGMKECSSCREIKPFCEFYDVTDSRGTHKAATCKVCSVDKNRQWKEKNRQHLFEYGKEYYQRPEVSERKRNRKIEAAKASPRWVMQITLRHGLKRRRTDNPATIEDLMRKFEANDGRCAVTGIKMTWRQGKVMPTSISLDRIDPDGGYSVDNIRLVCHAVNAFRGRMTDAEMLTMARAIVAKADADNKEPTWMPYLIHSEAA